jgi:hypothetical protein
MTATAPFRLGTTAVATAIALGRAPEVLAQGCAMCASALAGDDALGRAFNWSILVLMAAPYTVAGVVAGWIVYAHRRTSGRRRAAVIDLARVQRPAPAGRSGGEVP